MERATGIEPAPPAWEAEFSILYFQHLQIHSEKMYVHALPDLRVAGGRLGDGVSLPMKRLTNLSVLIRFESRFHW
jgi:hypothetical protein